MTKRSHSALRKNPPHFYDPRSGAEAFRLQAISARPRDYEPARTNCFCVYWIEAGSGSFWADAAEHTFTSDQLLFFVPYQYIRFALDEPLRGRVLHFHANFLCVETFHAETGCAGSLFNDPYGLPIVTPDEPAKQEIVELIARIAREQDERPLAYEDALLAYIKVLLILAARSKSEQAADCLPNAATFGHPVLGPLRELIEENYRVLHSPSDYAALLHMTTKTLGRCVREHLGKTLTELIRERILTHAKWQLLHTLRPVKEIAAEVGFQDELYFSRLFKKATGVSPKFFREFETEIRGGSNLSMLSSDTSMPSRTARHDNDTVSTKSPHSSG